MKTTLLLSLFCLLWISTVAQTPQAIKYQAVIRDGTGGIIANKAVFFKISILSGSPSGTVVYKENHTGSSTNAFGLVDIEIGMGAAELGTFSSINWGSGNYFIKVEIFPTGATVWQEMGTTQLLSVPYALYARDVQNKDDADADATNELQELQLTGTTLGLTRSTKTVTLPSAGGGDNWGTQVVKTNSTLTGKGTDADPLGVNSAMLAPSWSNIQNVPAGFADGVDNTGDSDSDTTNEIQLLSKTGSVVTLSKNGGSFVDEVNDADASPTNEIQKLSISGTTLTLDNGGGSVTLPSSGGGDNWGTQSVVTDASFIGEGVTSDPLKIADNGITSANILDGTIVNADISNDAINSSKIQDASIGTADLSNGAVTTTKIADNAVTVGKLPSGASLEKYLRGDGTWAIPTVGNITETDPTWSGDANLDTDIGRLGNVGIGTVSPTVLLHTYGTGTRQGNVAFVGAYKTDFPGSFPVSGAGTRLIWYPDKAAFRAGSVNDGRWDTNNIGSFSNAMGYNTTASGNVSLAFGSYSTASNTCSVAIGYGNISSGMFATAIGDNTTASGYGSTSMGDHTVAASYLCTAIGQYNVGGGTSNSWVTTDPLFEIGNGSSGISLSNALTVLKNGNTGVGTATPAYKLEVKGTANLNSGVTSGIALRCNGDEALWYNDTYMSWGYDASYNYFGKPVTIGKSASPSYTLVVNGEAAKSSGTSAWILTSDLRLKDLHGNYTKGLDEIIALQPVRFTYKADNMRQLPSGTEYVGFIAQDVEKIFPEAVTEASDGYLDFNMHAVNVAMVNAMKELNEKVDLLKAENNELKDRLEKLEKLVGVSVQK